MSLDELLAEGPRILELGQAMKTTLDQMKERLSSIERTRWWAKRSLQLQAGACLLCFLEGYALPRDRSSIKGSAVFCF